MVGDALKNDLSSDESDKIAKLLTEIRESRFNRGLTCLQVEKMLISACQKSNYSTVGMLRCS